MKQILFILTILFSTFSSYSQSHTYPGVPLYGTSAGQDRTYRSLQLGSAVISNTVTAVAVPDTITLIPGFVSGAGAVFHKNYFISAVDTVVLAIKDVSSSYTGSTMTFYLQSTSANTAFYFLGYSGWPTSQWALAAAATKYTITQNRWFTITFVCTGTAWVEQYHSQD